MQLLYEYEEINCPYCGASAGRPSEYELYDDDEEAEVYCDECGSDFILICHVRVSYSVEKKTEGETHEF